MDTRRRLTLIVIRRVGVEPRSTRVAAVAFSRKGILPMATRLQRLAEFDGNGEPSPDEAVQVLCEDKSGTYQLPFACRRVNGEWRNSESGSLVEAMVVGWRRPREARSWLKSRSGLQTRSRLAPTW